MVNKEIQIKYWENRIKRESIKTDKELAEALFKLGKEYEATVQDMDELINYFYSKYGKENIIEFANLRARLSSNELSSLYRDFDKFVEKYPEYAHLAPARDMYYKYDRAQYLKAKSSFQVLELAGREDYLLSDIMKRGILSGYAEAMEFVKAGSFKYILDDNIINKILKTKWVDSKNYSDRIWGNAKGAIDTLHQRVMSGIINGTPLDDMSKQLARLYNVELSDASRLIRTEHAYATIQGKIEGYKESDVEAVIFIATLDNRTSPICSAMDGKIIRINKLKQGDNIPPLHPNCRSTIAPYFEDIKEFNRMYRDAEGKNQRGPYRTHPEYKKDMYKEWYKKTRESLVNIGEMRDTIFKAIGENIDMDLITRKVSITDERIRHVAEERRRDYESFKDNLKEAIDNPLLVMKDANKTRSDTVIFIRETGKDRYLKIAVKMKDDVMTPYENSIMTIIGIGERTMTKIKNNKGHLIFYKRL